MISNCIINFYNYPHPEDEEAKYKKNKLYTSAGGTKWIRINAYDKNIGLLNITFFKEKAVEIAELLFHLRHKQKDFAEQYVKDNPDNNSYEKVIKAMPATINITVHPKIVFNENNGKNYINYNGVDFEVINNQIGIVKKETITEPKDNIDWS